jgi:hypothetical protein
VIGLVLIRLKREREREERTLCTEWGDRNLGFLAFLFFFLLCFLNANYQLCEGTI